MIQFVPIKVRLVFILIQCICVTSVVNAQKQFRLTVTPPAGADATAFTAFLNDGKHTEKINYTAAPNGALQFSGTFYSTYAVIDLQYPKSKEHPENTWGGIFFLDEQPAAIVLRRDAATGSPFEKYELKNAKDFRKEKERMDAYTSSERKRASAFEEKNMAIIDANKNPEINHQYFDVLLKNLNKKRLEYILKTPDSFYSFYAFCNLVANAFAPDSLLNILNNAFPDKYKNSNEGNYLKETLFGRRPLKSDSTAIGFVSRSIDGKTIRLSDFKGKNFVLLHFWATWCRGCVQEIPAISKINNEFASRNLKIISVALQSSKDSDYSKTIKKERMNWINIYNDDNLINKYGNRPVPRLCLIDKNGKILYDSAEKKYENDADLSQLKNILKNI